MAKSDNTSKRRTISQQLLNRLQKLAGEDKVRVIVRVSTPGRASGNRQSKEQRQASIAANQESAIAALSEIDAILDRHDGKRLGEPNALASIPVQTNRAGVIELAECDRVDAILEDQGISLLR